MTSDTLSIDRASRSHAGASAPEDWPFASVIIPVYNDVEGLTQCLEALHAQTYPEDRYEVIAVDNNSSEPIDSVVDPFPRARGAFESRQGSYAARNRGLEVARGEVLAFTDADCIPVSDWLENGMRALRRMDGRGIVGGRVEFQFQYPGRPRPYELVETSLFLNQEASVQRSHFAVTANMFTTQSVAADIGPFDPRLQSGGDREWGQRVHRAGFEVQYEPDARVKHPTRESAKALFRKIRRVTRGQHELRTRGDSNWVALLQEVFDLILPPLRTVGGLLTDSRTPPSIRFRAVGLLLGTRLWQIVEKLRLQFQR
jgi:glycosyltransferase involved in cell wall biosynthesis